MSGTANVTGSVVIDLTETGGTYGYSSQTVSVSIDGGAPVTLAVTAASSGDWSTSIWGSGGSVTLFYNHTLFSESDYTNGVLDTPSLLSWLNETTVNTLSAGGPTDGTITVPGLLSTTGSTPFGFPLSIDVPLSLLYNVTIAGGAQVFVDQANVGINSLTIGASGTVSAGTGPFTVAQGVTGGVLQAVAGGTIYLSGIVGGTTLATSGSGTLAVYSAVLSNDTIGGGTIEVPGGQSVQLDGTIANLGTIQLLGTATSTGFAEIQVGTATLTGSGVIALDGSGDNRLNASATLPAASLINQGNTIKGHGAIGNAFFSFANHGLIDSTDAGKSLLIATTGTLDNTGGTIDAAASAYVDLQGTVLNGGLIRADTLGTVYLEETVSNATLSGGGVLSLVSGGLSNDTIAAGTTLQVPNAQHAQLAGTIFNQGTIALLGSSSPGGLAELQIVGTATLSGGGTVELDGPGNSLIDSGGTAASLTNLALIRGSGTIGDASLSFANQGQISADVLGQTLSVGTVANAGTIGATNGGTLITGGLTGSGTLTVGSASKLEMQGGIGAQTIALNGTGALLQWDTPGSTSATINVGAGQTIDLRNVTPGSVSYSSLTNQLTFTPLGGSATSLELILQSGVTGLQINPESGNTTEILTLCFCAGTQIRTPAGEVPVEDLAVGDLVLTRAGQMRPIVWIGFGCVLATRGRRNAATPVTIRKGAFADNVPHHDLRVTKGHAFYFDGVLIPVEFLVNHRSILWDDRAQEVRLYHVELGRHDVLLANGAPAESYRDDGNRWLFRNANSGWHLPPQPPCAPIHTGGKLVDAVWRRLLDRAGPRPGLPMTDDPDLHLLVDGRRIDPSARYAGLYLFRLERAPATAIIMSRVGSPAELGRSRDPRPLGVAVRRVTLLRGKRLRTLEAADAALTDGFHEHEGELGLRWTNGAAMLPPDFFHGFAAPMQVVLHVAGATQYPLWFESQAMAAA